MSAMRAMTGRNVLVEEMDWPPPLTRMTRQAEGSTAATVKLAQMVVQAQAWVTVVVPAPSGPDVPADWAIPRVSVVASTGEKDSDAVGVHVMGTAAAGALFSVASICTGNVMVVAGAMYWIGRAVVRVR
jgi:hypothetical protein